MRNKVWPALATVLFAASMPAAVAPGVSGAFELSPRPSPPASVSEAVASVVAQGHEAKAGFFDGSSVSVSRVWDAETGELVFEKVEEDGEHGHAAHSGATGPSSCTNEGTGVRTTTGGQALLPWNVLEQWRFNPAGAPGGIDWRAHINAGEDVWERTRSACGASDIISFNHDPGPDTTAVAAVNTANVTCGSTDGINAIGFQPVVGTGTLAAACVWWDGNRRIYESDIEFNTAHQFCDVANTPYPANQACTDLWSVAAHEFGHYLGIDHSPSTGAVMHSHIAQGNASLRLLSLGDVEVANGMYPAGVAYDDVWVTQGVELGVQANHGTLSPAHDYYAYVDLRNTGGLPWAVGGRVKLGTSAPDGRCSAFATSDWNGCGRASLVDTNVSVPGKNHIAPGETARFRFRFRGATGTAGKTYREYFRPLAEGITWMRDQGIYFDWKFGTFAATKGSQTSPAVMVRGTASNFTVDYRNDGTAPWFVNGGPVVLGTQAPENRCSAFAGAGWSGCGRAGGVDKNLSSPGSGVVLPGQWGQFVFEMKVPTLQNAGSYTERFRPVAEMISWMGTDASFTFTVT